MRMLFFLLSGFFFSVKEYEQNVGIGTNTPNPSAKVEISSTDMGFLPPRMTYIQRNAIQHPAKGLVIWCADCDEMQVYNGFMWTNMSGAAASIITLPGVKICYHTWMYKNISVRTYRNGDLIPVVTDPVAWANLTTGAMCWYNNDSATFAPLYGALYNWHALNDPRGLAPAGWHLPTNVEWNILSNCLGGDSIAGGKLKDLSLLWTAPNTAANNSSGFTGLPGGFRNSNGLFSGAGNYGYWWSSTATNGNNAWSRFLLYGNANLTKLSNLKASGFSVRCVRN